MARVAAVGRAAAAGALALLALAHAAEAGAPTEAHADVLKALKQLVSDAALLWRLESHLVIEATLLLVIGYLLLQKSRPARTANDDKITDAEVDYLCGKWRPEPLAPPLPEDESAEPAPSLADAPRVILASPPNATVDVYLYPRGGEHRTAYDADAGALRVNAPPPAEDGALLVRGAVNLASANFLGLGGDSKVAQDVVAATEKYGVGSCGPRGFYGTIDVHLTLEEELASFVGYEHAVLYSYDIATPQSVIPAFAKSGDVAVIDEKCSYAIRSGLALSRATVVEFRHNDMAHLEEQLKAVRSDKKLIGNNRTDKRRLYIVVEGVYANVGTVCPLPTVIKLKEQYRFRLYLDDSFGFGVMGHTGRGTFERFGLPVTSVDVYTSSLSNAMGTVGGFCCTHETNMVTFQRLNASGYVFSASLPPLLAAGAIGALRHLRSSNGSLPASCRANAAMVRNWLSRMTKPLASNAKPSADGCPDGALAGADGRLRVRESPCDAKDGDAGASPLMHLELAEADGSPSTLPWFVQQRAISEVARRMLEPENGKKSVLAAVPLYSAIEGSHAPAPSLRLCVSAMHSQSDLHHALHRLAAVAPHAVTSAVARSSAAK